MSHFLRFAVPIGAALFVTPLFAQPLVYVTDPAANTLTALDSGNNTIVRTLPDYTGAQAVVVSADGTRVYVAESGDGKIAILDATKISDPNQDPLIEEIAVGGQPIALALDTRTNLLYVADAENNRAASYDLGNVDPANPEPVATYNVGEGFTDMALSPDGKMLALTSTATPAITLYNLRLIAAGLQGKTVVSLNSPPRALAYNARGDRLWVATEAGFSSYSLTTGAVTHVAESGGTTAVAFSSRLQLVYFGAGSGNIVYSYVPGGADVGRIGTYAPVSGLALSADGTRLYAVQNCEGCGIAVISTATGQALQHVQFGIAPATRGRFAGPGAIYAANAASAGAAGMQLSATLKATDRDSRGLTYTAVTEPAAGTLNLNPSGDFTYTPPAGYSGVQAFVWQAAATSGDGAPVNPASPPITETLEIRPQLSTIADQNAGPGATLGPFAFTISGSLPFTIKTASSESDVVNPGQISLSPGCGTSSLSCSIGMTVGNSENGTTQITITAVGAEGLQATSRFKIIVGNGDNGGGGGFALAGLGALVLLMTLCALARRRHGSV